MIFTPFVQKNKSSFKKEETKAFNAIKELNEIKLREKRINITNYDYL